MSDALIAKLRKLTGDATPGPWKWLPDRRTLWAYVDGKNQNIIWPLNVAATDEAAETWAQGLGACGTRSEAEAEANARLIESAPALLTEAADALTALGEERDRLRAALTRAPALSTLRSTGESGVFRVGISRPVKRPQVTPIK